MTQPSNTFDYSWDKENFKQVFRDEDGNIIEDFTSQNQLQEEQEVSPSPESDKAGRKIFV